jgi:hypothetical protein
MSEHTRYSFRGFGNIVEYELSDDAVIVTRKGWNGTEYRVPIRLADIDPMAFEMRVRDSKATAVFGLVATLGAIPFTFFIFRVLSFLPEVARLMLIPCWIVGWGLLALLHPFKIHSVGYRHHSGANALTIAKRGANSPEFDTFVEALARAIPKKEGPG